MQAFRNLFSPTASRLLLGLLLLAVMVAHGPGGALRQVLGATHRHVGGAPVAGVTAITAVPAELAALGALAAPGAFAAFTAFAAFAAAMTSYWLFDDGLVSGRAWRQDHPTRGHAADLSAPAHRHASFERHRHDFGDASVVALDDGGAPGHRGGEVPSAASGVGADGPPGLAREPGLAALAAAVSAWPRAPSQTWQNALARLPERPPRT